MLGRQRGGRWVAVAQNYTVKATYTEVEPLDKEHKRVDREDSSKQGQALQWNLSWLVFISPVQELSLKTSAVFQDPNKFSLSYFYI